MQTAASPIISFNVQALMSWVLLIAFSTGAIVLLSFLLMRGFWAQFIEPKLNALFVDWYNNVTVKQKRDDEIKTAIVGHLNSTPVNQAHEQDTQRIVTSWYNLQDTRDERERFTKKVIDDQIQRVDGVIRKEIVQHVDKTGKDIDEKIANLQDDVNVKFDKLAVMLEKSSEFHTQVLSRLARIEGSLAIKQTDPNGNKKP